MNKFGYKALAIAMAGVAVNAHGAGLDRSGQDVTAFLQDGTYAEAAYTYIDADVSGYDNAVASGASTQANYVKGNETGDMAEAYDFFRYAVKTDVNDRVSVGILYDEPFGASVEYSGNNNFVAQGADATVAALTNGQVPNAATAQAALTQAQTGIATLQSAIAATAAAGGDTTALQTQLATTVATAQSLGGALNAAAASESQKGEGTKVEIRTQNVTGLIGFNFGNADNKVQVYGGPAAQRLTGEVHLRGTTYQAATGYDARISPDQAYGWVAGVSYSKPAIALKAALTYRSEIEHESTIAEVFPALGAANGTKTQDFKVTLPESYNLDFQTGVNPTTLVTAKVRYVPWSSFDIQPTLYTQTTNTPIIDYAKDQWSGELGVAKKLSDKFVVSGTVGYDSGGGNPASTLGPIKGYYSVGGGFRYNLTPNWSASLGAKYLKFGDADAQIPTRAIVGDFGSNDGFIAGLKIAYQAK